MLILGVAWFYYNKPLAPPEQKEAKEIARANELCRNLNIAGNSYARAGMFDSALVCYREALRIAEKYSLTERMAASYQDISNLFDLLNEKESTEFYLKRAVALRRLSRKKGDQLVDLLEQGTFRFRNLGDLDSGKVLLEKALKEARAAGNYHTEAVALNNLGLLHTTLENYDSATALFQAAVTASHHIRDWSTEAGALHNIANIYILRDQTAQALPWLFKAMEAAHNGELFADEASALRDAALLRMEKGQFKLARVHLQKAQELYQKIGDYQGVAECRFYLDLLADIERFRHRYQVLDSCIKEMRRRAEAL
jgi:tetratricopeptide (TPR) repeat protein